MNRKQAVTRAGMREEANILSPRSDSGSPGKSPCGVKLRWGVVGLQQGFCPIRSKTTDICEVVC